MWALTSDQLQARGILQINQFEFSTKVLGFAKHGPRAKPKSKGSLGPKVSLN